MMQLLPCEDKTELMLDGVGSVADASGEEKPLLTDDSSFDGSIQGSVKSFHEVDE
jgi:hypothetical protein